MIYLSATLLLATSLWILWRYKPKAEWRGDAAANFASALITGLFAALVLLPFAEIKQAKLLLMQLSLYAASPLFASVLITKAFNMNWSRMIWGRILLGWCVVFELTRHNQGLELLRYGVMALALVGIALTLAKRNEYLYCLQVFLVILLTILTFAYI